MIIILKFANYFDIKYNLIFSPNFETFTSFYKRRFLRIKEKLIVPR